MAIKTINVDLCNGCKICVDVCSMDVIRFDEKTERPYIAYPEDCIWCFSCEAFCPLNCIEVIPTKVRRIPASM